MGVKSFIIIFLAVIIFVLLLTIIGVYSIYGKILPNVFVLDTKVSGLTKDEAVSLLTKKYNLTENIKLQYETDDGTQQYLVSTADFSASYDFSNTIKSAYSFGRSGKLKNDILAVSTSFKNPKRFDIQVNYDKDKLAEIVSVFAGGATIEPVYPSVYVENKEIQVNAGVAGNKIDNTQLENEIIFNLSQNNNSNIKVNLEQVNPVLSEDEVKATSARAEKLVNYDLILKLDDQEISIPGSELITFIGSSNTFNETKINEKVDELAQQLDRDPQNPVFFYKSGKVQEFKPALFGIQINKADLVDKIKSAINNFSDEIDSQTVDVAFDSSKPDYETSDVNDMGITELIGKGESNFRGSISSRIYNINLAANRLNGTLVAPGEIFSFNRAVGDISKLTGYKEAYVIQDGKTILGDGGGVCQVSTTVFRAALNSGLPIIERRAHAYRVGYYEQGYPPGLDATVYQPTTDLKFKNDTDSYILIQTVVDNKNSHLTFEFYGTSDGRVAEVSKPVITDSTPPPDDVYVDDPTLPAGEVKHVEYAAWGAKVYFNYKVTRDGEEIYKKTFYSNFRPWGNVYMRGTGPAQ
jgi:vancomycin resistance protein YoaR